MESIRIFDPPEIGYDGSIIHSANYTEVLGIPQYATGSEIQHKDYGSTSQRLRVFLPAGLPIGPNHELEIRGVKYKILHAPFDWAIGRTPWFQRHSPMIEVMCERRDVDG